jgi:hypothetical protein
MPGKPTFFPGVESRHLVVDDGDADRVVAAANVSVHHVIDSFCLVDAIFDR